MKRTAILEEIHVHKVQTALCNRYGIQRICAFRGGSDVSEERVSIVAAACSLIRKSRLFLGRQKSYAIGWDDSWGSPMTVSAEGQQEQCTVRSYGLDTIGFCCMRDAYYNGLGGKDAGIGNHTQHSGMQARWWTARVPLKPGDLVFIIRQVQGDDNHVGIVVGVNDNGSLLVVLLASQNGVVVRRSMVSQFQYVREKSAGAGMIKNENRAVDK